MDTKLRAGVGAAAVALALGLAAFARQQPGGIPALKAMFAAPAAEYSSAPLWVWNDDLTDEMVLGTLRDLASQDVKQVFVHPRPGLMTPYLSPEWFRLWKLALEEAERLDVRVWIYDENSYPSGFAGGFVPEAMPESRGRGLQLREVDSPPAWAADTLAVFEVAGPAPRDVSAAVRAASPLPAGRYVVASVSRAEPGPWFGGKSYVDLLYPGVTERFLSVTLDAYRREVGAAFGRRVPGVFTDEPELRPAGGLPWTDGLPQAFERRWGYGLTAALPALQYASGDWKRVRHNYYQVLLEQFVERWGKPYFEYCARNGLEFTGHYWEHEWPNCTGVPDNMAMSAWQQRPGIDTLMNQYAEGTHAQFGNVRAVKEVASVANQLGRPRTISEAYGAGGWDLRFEDMKRIGDWLYALGINTLDQHLSYVSLRGARKRDHPQSFSYHEPWWGSYGESARYFARLSVAMSAGSQVNDVLVLEPTTTAWMYNATGKPAPELEALGSSFQDLLLSLERAQVEYDLGSEDVIARRGAVEGRRLRVGQRTYGTVVLPPFTENLNAATLGLLEPFVESGGTLLAAGPPPARVDGEPSDRVATLARAPAWNTVDPKDLPAALLELQAPGFHIGRAAGDRGILFHHRRELGGGEQLLLLVNTSVEAGSSGTVESAARGVERWDPATGTIAPYPFERTPAGSRLRFELPEAGSLLLRLSRETLQPGAGPREGRVPVAAAGPPAVRRVGPNVLVLDYVDVEAGGEAVTRTYFYQASQFGFRKNGVDRNPWDSAVQFRDELIRRTFPAGSGVEATYRFTVNGPVPADLAIVVERPDLYAVTCNGQPVAAARGAWWLDRSFGRIDIARAARAGENEVTLKASPFTMYHEVEPAYLLGSFALEAAPSGFVVVGDRPVGLGAWNVQGHPFYSEGVGYAERFEVARPAGRYAVRLGKWYGSVAKVAVNGRAAGIVYAAPWTLDVTDLVRAGSNTVEVTVVGTLKNTLGPHHGKPPLGTAWPAMFQKAPNPGPPPGGDYSTVGYGLFEPFELIRLDTP
ncbi:MAG: putative alpha-L-rhamnosidase [Acidobacteria bacterium]|nr:putative alpha-L-rhamnosidase [Acidobacteriota bacterium]